MITDYLPAPARKFIYSLIATYAAIEGVCDLAEYPYEHGLLSEKPQSLVLGIATVLGLSVAAKKANDVATTQITIEDDPGDAGELGIIDCIVVAAICVLIVAIDKVAF